MAETEAPDRPMGIRGSKKRKATVPRDREREERLVIGEDGDSDGDDEEKKIEKFLALVKNYREARDRLARSRLALASAAGGTDCLDADHHKRRRQTKDSVSAWDLCFQREDFVEEAVLVEKATETLAFGPSRSARDGVENNGEGGGLDLRLSL